MPFYFQGTEIDTLIATGYTLRFYEIDGLQKLVLPLKSTALVDPYPSALSWTCYPVVARPDHSSATSFAVRPLWTLAITSAPISCLRLLRSIFTPYYS